MRILAIESTGRQAQAGLFDKADVVIETRALEPFEGPAAGGRSLANAPGTSSSRQLIPQIQSLLREANWTIGEIGLICLTIGPGSFTGLRIGLVTAKTLCYATGAKIVGVPTLQVIARQTREQMALDEGCPIRVVLSAHRQQLFTSRYVAGGQPRLTGQGDVAIVGADEWLNDLPGGEILTGSGLQRLESRLPEAQRGERAPVDCWFPTTGMLATIGWERASQGACDDLWTIEPRYCRPSYAEI